MKTIFLLIAFSFLSCKIACAQQQGFNLRPVALASSTTSSSSNELSFLRDEEEQPALLTLSKPTLSSSVHAVIENIHRDDAINDLSEPNRQLKAKIVKKSSKANNSRKPCGSTTTLPFGLNDEGRSLSGCNKDAQAIGKTSNSGFILALKAIKNFAKSPSFWLQIGSMLANLVVDLVCNNINDTPPPQLLIDDVIQISKEEAKKVVAKVYVSSLNSLVGDIEAFTRKGCDEKDERGCLPVPQLLTLARKANEIETGIADVVGYNGMKFAHTAASIKFQLLGYYLQNSINKDIAGCCHTATNFLKQYANTSINNFKKLRDDFENYKKSKDNASNYEVERGCILDACIDCSDFHSMCCDDHRCSGNHWSNYVFDKMFARETFFGYWKGRNQKKLVTVGGPDSYIQECICKEDELRDKLKSSVDKYFNDLYNSLWTPEALEIERNVHDVKAKLENGYYTCPTNENNKCPGDTF